MVDKMAKNHDMDLTSILNEEPEPEALNSSTVQVETINLCDILEKMVEINAIVRVEKIFEKKIVNGSPVVNIIVNDGTRRGLLSLWGDDINLIEGIDEGDAILIENAYSPKEYKDRIHLSIGRGGKISKVESDLPPLKELVHKIMEKKYSYSRKNISELNENIGAEIRGIIIALHSKEPYFPICGQCNKKMILKRGYAICKCGNKVSEEDENLKWLFLCNVTIDDGTGNIRVTLNNNTNVLDFKYLKELILDDEDILPYLTETLLGMDVVVKGIPTYDDYTKNLIFKTRQWDKTDPISEFNNLAKNKCIVRESEEFISISKNKE
ncbi:MAG: hypothetical protein PWP15_1258 [Methanothermococcus sp.]|jgi:ssDNA-binding replication factor A large subunit|nr:hypothetical protein [Methanothermococcus sp.]